MARHTKHKEKILELLKNHKEGLTMSEIKGMLGLKHVMQLYPSLNRLVSEDLVVLDGYRYKFIEHFLDNKS